mmetsp:Transcript_13037/g.32551  ORF Transcript_13037/g.32551 Transcript_13037/m.32551 type:complete len:130 (-) Transcript_13037:418-807(-)
MMGGMGMSPNLEINPTHPVVLKLKDMVASGASTAAAEQYAQLLHEVAVVSSGYEIADPGAFAKRITALMADGEAGLAALSVSAPAPAPSKAEEMLTVEADIQEGGEVEVELPEDSKKADDSKPVNPDVA